MTGGVFISFEGGEGAGKTTQIDLLAEKLVSQGLSVVKTLEPGGTPLGREIRRQLVTLTTDPPTPRAELLLYEADRAHHVEKVILPALSGGKVILSDRYADSTTAYQGWGRGLDLSLIQALNESATGGLKPHRTLFLDLDPVVGVTRSLKRQEKHGEEAEARFEAEKMEFHHRVRAGFLKLAAVEPERIRTVDAGLDPAEVAKAVWRNVSDLFPGLA